MRTTLARPKPMPRRREREAWWSALVWLLFCVAMVAIGVFLTPRIGAVYASEDLATPVVTPNSGLVSDIVDTAVPMAATVLYPNELSDPHALPVVSKR